MPWARRALLWRWRAIWDEWSVGTALGSPTDTWSAVVITGWFGIERDETPGSGVFPPTASSAPALERWRTWRQLVERRRTWRQLVEIVEHQLEELE